MFRELTRPQKKLPMEECIALLKTEKRGVLSVCGEDGYPYGMPMNHFYDETDGKIYFHSGKGGHRTDAIKKDDKVSFCVCDSGTKKDGHWALTVKSVVVFGRIRIIEEPERIVSIATKLSRKFTTDEDYIKAEIKGNLKNTLLLELTIEHLCGKWVVEA